MFTVMDLFCGAGGFSQGFINTWYFNVIYGVDVIPVAAQTFTVNHPDAICDVGDIRGINIEHVAERIPTGKHVDVIIGGPQCQGFSSIRPYRSSTEDDPRNSLFNEFAAYIDFFTLKLLFSKMYLDLSATIMV